MIPKADGDSTPLGQRPLGVLPVVYRLWASLGLGHLGEWVDWWLPKPVLCWWGSIAQLHIMVADVVKSFDTVG